jgi:hypothetical protein
MNSQEIRRHIFIRTPSVPNNDVLTSAIRLAFARAIFGRDYAA